MAKFDTPAMCGSVFMAFYSKGIFSKDDFSYCLHIKAENVQMVITSDWMALETSSLDHNTILIRETFSDVLVKIRHDDVT